MAHFSQLRASTNPETSIPRAVLTPAVVTIAADGNIDDAEIAQLNNLVSFSPIFQGLSSDDLDDMTNSIMDDLLHSGAGQVIEASIQDMSPELRETAFCFAMRVAMADGVLDESEKNVLAGTAQQMQLPKETFESIFQVVTMMQRSAAT